MVCFLIWQLCIVIIGLDNTSAHPCNLIQENSTLHLQSIAQSLFSPEQLLLLVNDYLYTLPITNLNLTHLSLLNQVNDEPILGVFYEKVEWLSTKSQPPKYFNFLTLPTKDSLLVVHQLYSMVKRHSSIHLMILKQVLKRKTSFTVYNSSKVFPFNFHDVISTHPFTTIHQLGPTMTMQGYVLFHCINDRKVTVMCIVDIMDWFLDTPKSRALLSGLYGIEQSKESIPSEPASIYYVNTSQADRWIFVKYNQNINQHPNAQSLVLTEWPVGMILRNTVYMFFKDKVVTFDYIPLNSTNLKEDSKFEVKIAQRSIKKFFICPPYKVDTGLLSKWVIKAIILCSLVVVGLIVAILLFWCLSRLRQTSYKDNYKTTDSVDSVYGSSPYMYSGK